MSVLFYKNSLEYEIEYIEEANCTVYSSSGGVRDWRLYAL